MTSVLTDDFKQGALKMIPLGRVGSADDVAHSVTFLASDEAAYITGHVFFVVISVALATGLLGTSGRRRDYLFSITALVFCVGNIWMSGSRSAGLIARAISI